MRLTDYHLRMIREQKRFDGFKQLDKLIPLSDSVLFGDEEESIVSALKGEGDESPVDMAEDTVGEYLGERYVVGLGSVTAAVHIALKLAAEKLYGSSSGISTPSGTGRGGVLCGQRVFCPDFASWKIVNPVIYEGGEPVFIDAGDDNWAMDPEVLEMAFAQYPDVRIVIISHVYGFPGKVQEIKKICEEHGAVLIEDASLALGAKISGRFVGTIGDYGVIGFDEGGIVTGYGGAMLIVDDCYSYNKARYWADGAKSPRAWPQHDELGYDYRMNRFSAAMINRQMVHIDEIIAKKKAIYDRYEKQLRQELMIMIPVDEYAEPNYCISSVLMDSNIAFDEVRDDRDYTFTDGHGTTSPMEIYEVMKAFNVECKPVYKSLHLQPVFRMYEQFTLSGGIRRYEDFFQDEYSFRCDRALDLSKGAVCLPSSISLTEEEQDYVIALLYSCFDKKDLRRLA